MAATAMPQSIGGTCGTRCILPRIAAPAVIRQIQLGGCTRLRIISSGSLSVAPEFVLFDRYLLLLQRSGSECRLILFFSPDSKGALRLSAITGVRTGFVTLNQFFSKYQSHNRLQYATGSAYKQYLVSHRRISHIDFGCNNCRKHAARRVLHIHDSRRPRYRQRTTHALEKPRYGFAA